jgi:DNA helicase-2/ATP-dependent DNA helicase PcrA
MSSSKQSKSSIKSPISDTNGNTFFSNIVPSKIFCVSRNDKYPLVQPELNRKIAKLTNPVSLKYTTKIAKIMSVLRDREVVEYQQSLMKAAIDDISEDTVDIDYIRIGLKLTQNDIDLIFNEEDGFKFVRNSESNNRRTFLKIKPSDLPLKINKDFAYENDIFKSDYIIPFYTKRYEVFVDGDNYRVINIHIANLKNKHNKGRNLKYNCEIEFIPTRVGNELVSYMLYQFHSVLQVNRYNSLMKNALLLELHTGYIMYGVSQLFGFMLTKDNRRSASECFPKQSKRAKETTYIGERYYDRYIAYDKTLKENKVFIGKCLKGFNTHWKKVANQIDGIKEWFPSQVCAYRLESRMFFNPAKNNVVLKDINVLKSLLGDIQLIKPMYLAEIDDYELEALIKNKSLAKVKDLRDLIEQRHGKGTACFDIDRANLDNALMLKLESVLKAIFTPIKLLEPTKGNYRSQVNAVRKAIKSIVESNKEISHSPSDIVASNKRAVYVEGCPGAGKTRLIVDRVKFLLDSGVKSTSITVLAYTNPAKMEFASRIKKLGVVAKGVTVDTFSGWCNKLLNRLEGVKKSAIKPEDAKKMLAEIIFDGGEYDMKTADFVANKAYLILERMANFENQSIGGVTKKINPEWVDDTETLQELFDAYEAKKKAENKRDFNDMLVNVKQQLDSKATRKRLKSELQYFIVDEAQDCNSVQWEITKHLYSAGINVFMVGDPAQSIFEFRGAKSYFLKKFEDVFPKKSARYQLRLNYRSTPSIVELGNIVRRKISPNLFKSESVLTGGKDVKPSVKYCSNFDEALAWLVKDIKEQETDATSHLILCRYKDHISLINEAMDRAGLIEEWQKVTRTYHGAKGIEAAHCYVIDPLLDVKGLSSYKEELCNTYVAITRAKAAMTLIINKNGRAFYPAPSGNGGKKGSIFLELPKNLLEVAD